MLILQIILIPIVLFLLLCTIFFIGSLGTLIVSHPTPADQPSQMHYDATRAQAEEYSYSGIPIIRI